METEETEIVEKERKEKSWEYMYFPEVKIKKFKEEKSLNGAKCSWKLEENNNLRFIRIWSLIRNI